jgi:T4-like virus tail tube protein gp19.
VSLSDAISSATSSFNPSAFASTFAPAAATGGLSFLGSKLASVAGPGALGTLGAGMSPGNDLAGIQARSDPLLSYCWYAQLPTITPTPAGSAPINQNSGSILGGIAAAASTVVSSLASSLGGSVFASSSAVSLPWYYVEEAQLPFRNFSSKPIFREGRDRHYVDKYMVDNLTLHFYLDSSNTALQYLQAWQNAMISPFAANSAATSGGGFGRPSQYKQPIYIYILDVTKSQMAIIEYTECWPTNLSALAMDSGASNRLVGQVSFSVGDVFVNIVGVAQSLVNGVMSNPSQFSNLLSAAGSKVLGNAAASVSSSISSSVSSMF